MLAGTILCYGQTGAGKTFTMTGATENYQQRGLIPRAIQQLYKDIEERTDYSTNVRWVNIRTICVTKSWRKERHCSHSSVCQTSEFHFRKFPPEFITQESTPLKHMSQAMASSTTEFFFFNNIEEWCMNFGPLREDNTPNSEQEPTVAGNPCILAFT